MLLLLGLGNPEKIHENTPHNLGRFCLESFCYASGGPDFRMEKKFNALIAEHALHGEKIIAALPETFMNNSGEAASALANFYKIPAENIWVLHDEADIPLGNVRIAFGASPAGHNGVKSVAEKIGTMDFWRFRIGITPSEPLVMPLEAYVLQKNAIEESAARAVADKVTRLLDAAIGRGIAEIKKEAD